jgi:hypothetical protein
MFWILGWIVVLTPFSNGRPRPRGFADISLRSGIVLIALDHDVAHYISLLSARLDWHRSPVLTFGLLVGPCSVTLCCFIVV